MLGIMDAGATQMTVAGPKAVLQGPTYFNGRPGTNWNRIKHKLQPRSKQSSLIYNPATASHVVDRMLLGMQLYQEAVRLYPDHVTFHFNSQLAKLDIEKRWVYVH